jgi:hypothetical protein
MSSDERKESIRAALRELSSPASMLSGYEAMKTLHHAVCNDFNCPDGSIGDFVGDDDLKEEIFSAKVVQVVMDVSQDKEEYPPHFYHLTSNMLSLLCCENVELANAFVANGGVAFLLEYLETFSSNQMLLRVGFELYRFILHCLNINEAADFAGMILGKLVDVFELNYETADDLFYCRYCTAVAVSMSLPPGLDLDMKHKLHERITVHVYHGVLEHKYDEEVQAIGRWLLPQLVGEEKAKELSDHADLCHCAEEYCAACA